MNYTTGDKMSIMFMLGILLALIYYMFHYANTNDKKALESEVLYCIDVNGYVHVCEQEAKQFELVVEQTS